MPPVARRVAALVMACAILCACGGGGGGGSPSPPAGGGSGGTGGTPPPPPPPPVPTPNAFLPTDTRIELTYAGQAAPARFEATIQQAAAALAPFRYAIGGREYYVSTPDSVAFAGFYAPLVVVSGVGTFSTDARFDGAVTLFDDSSVPQQYIQVSGVGTVTITPTYGARPLTYSGRVAYLGTEPITTPVGTFQSKRARLEIAVQTTIEGNTLSLPYVVDLWFARGIGIVQRSEASQLLKLAGASGPDGDADGVFDGIDAFPADPSEKADLDGDGVGDNADTDDDGDAVADAVDRFPRDAGESTDFDNDGIGDNADPDDDDDFLFDAVDPFPRDIHNTDTDGDGTQDFYDTDDDNDTFADAVDRFPLDVAEWLDHDNDGTGDNGDFDDDNDAVPDDVDAYPFDYRRAELLSVDRTSIQLNAVLGGFAPGSYFQVNGNGIDWEIESSAPWLTPDTGQDTFGTVLVLVDTDLAGLDVGAHTAQITIRDLGDPRTLTIDVTLTVSLPTFSTTTDHLTFDGTFGWSDLTRPVDVTFDLGFTDYPVTLELTFPIAGAVEAAFVGTASYERHRLNVTLDPAKMRSGHYTGTLTLRANVLGQTITRTIAIEATGSQRVVYPSADGVAFTRMDSGGTPPFDFYTAFLTRTISVLDSYGVVGTPWVATSDQPWLSVTPSGVTGGELTLTADPLAEPGLTDGLHWATVSISSSDGNVEATLPIRVSLWLATPWPDPSDELPGAYVQLASDPVRPYVYAHDGAGTIDVYHAHAHTLLPSIGPLGGTLGPMVTSTDGRWLFVLDPTNGSVTRIDLDDTAVRTTWPLLEGKPATDPSTLVYARPSGHPVLLLNDGRVVDAATGGVFPTGHLFTLPPFDIAKASPTGDRVCVLNTQQSPFSGACFKLLYGDQGTPDVKHSPLIGFDGFSVPGAPVARDLAFMPNGDYIVVAVESNPRPLVLFNVLGGYLGPLISDDPDGTIYSARAVTTAADGSVRAQILNGSDGFERLLVVNENRSTRIHNYYIEGNETTLYGQLVTSGDARSTVFLAGDTPPQPTTSSTVEFVLVLAPPPW